MGSRAAYYFAAFVAVLVHIVKGQSTVVRECENADSSINIIVEQNSEAIRQLSVEVQSMRSLLTESLKEMKNLKDSVASIRQSVDLCSKNQTQAFETGDWLVIMHRYDGSVDFNRNWFEYRNGFGNTAGGEFWFGNEEVYDLTNKFNCTLRIEVQFNTSGEWKYAEYSSFTLDSEDNNYAIHLTGFSGNAGDGLTNSVLTIGYHGGMNFTTRDRDHDRSPRNCAQTFVGGWWFNSCIASCLTCKEDFEWYFPGGTLSNRNLRSARMMIKSN